MKKLIIPLFLGFIVLQSSCKKKTEPISPEIQNITESVYAFGILKSKNQHEVFSKSLGILEMVFVKEGDLVKKGDSLFQIENENSKVATQNAKLTAENADYNVNADKLRDAQNSVELAEKKLTNDSLLYSRQKSLWKNGIGSRIEFEQKELNFESSKVVLTNTRIRYDDLKRQLKLVSAQSKNNLLIAQSNEEDFLVRSNVDGVVYKINKEKGELVSNATPLAVLGEDEFIIELNIDELDIVKIKPGQQVIIRMDSYQSQVYEATVTNIYPMMNERTRTFKTEATFTKKPEQLYPNLTLEANIIIAAKQNILTIPRNYLTNDSLVMLENGTLQKVVVGLMDYNLVEIKNGINASSRIILPAK